MGEDMLFRNEKEAQEDAFVFDVNRDNFEEAVLEASMEKPVILDFWAPWCAPCRQLMPMLEGTVAQAGGHVVLAKVNIDEHPELAQAFRVQSVPTVLALYKGQPVTGFQGGQPQSQIDAFVSELLKIQRQDQPDAIDVEAVLEEAMALQAEGDLAGAQQLYGQILQQEAEHAGAYAGVIRIFLMVEDLEQARAWADNAPDIIQKAPEFSSALTALELAEKALSAGGDIEALAAKVEKEPDNHALRFELAEAQFGAGFRAEAIEQLLEIINRDRGWNDKAANAELLKYFDALGAADPLTIRGRKMLSRILFS